MAAETSATARLQRLVNFVARQQPQLRWAAGDRPDGTTVLVTDLASGWIPPGVAIPTGMRLLDPAHRRGDLKSLLGEVDAATCCIAPHHLPPATDAEPVPTSTRARQGCAVDELNWNLGHATRWRDGLPRLAHTIAKATAAGTGVLDSEITLLHDHVRAVCDHVLNTYPDTVDYAAVGNWQLLAAIDALAQGDTSTGNYHFAWFQALNRIVNHQGQHHRS